MNRQKLYKRMEAKFLAGAKEHKGDLDDMELELLLEEILNEQIDQIFYLNSLINKIKKWKLKNVRDVALQNQ